MGKSASRTPAGAGVRSPETVVVSDEELLRRLEEPWRDGLMDDLGDRDEAINRLLDLALRRLRRSGAAARRMVEDAERFRTEFDAGIVELQASQRRTRAVIEELVNGE